MSKRIRNNDETVLHAECVKMVKSSQEICHAGPDDKIKLQSKEIKDKRRTCAMMKAERADIAGREQC